VITTVAPDSRRAVRAARQQAAPRDRDDLPAARTKTRSPLVAGVIGALIGAAVLAGVGIAVLFLTGIL